MSVPQLGLYMPENKAFKIQIKQANPSNGVINAVYESAFSPEGLLTSTGDIGSYAWVHSDSHGTSGFAPFCIQFRGFVRPSGRAYCIMDTWNGAYLENNTMLLTGTRAYVNSAGVTESISLGTHIFSQA
jgi:hypothetical protein